MLRQAAGAQRLAEERLLADLGVTPPQLAALALIGAHPGLLAADLARKAKLTPQTVQLIVANLRRAGFAREEDGAASALAGAAARPNAAGREDSAQGRERTRAASARLVDGLRPKRESALRRWLAAVAAGLPSPGAALEAGRRYRPPSCANRPPMLGRDRLNRQAAQLDQRHVGETRVGLDLAQRHRALERLDRANVHHAELAALVGRVGMEGLYHLDNADDLLADIGMIEKGEIAQLHRHHLLFGEMIAHAGPAGAFCSAGDHLVPGPGCRARS